MRPGRPIDRLVLLVIYVCEVCDGAVYEKGGGGEWQLEP